MLSFTDDEDVAPGEMRQDVDGLLRRHINGCASRELSPNPHENLTESILTNAITNAPHTVTPVITFNEFGIACGEKHLAKLIVL